MKRLHILEELYRLSGCRAQSPAGIGPSETPLGLRGLARRVTSPAGYGGRKRFVRGVGWDGRTEACQVASTPSVSLCRNPLQLLLLIGQSYFYTPGTEALNWRWDAGPPEEASAVSAPGGRVPGGPSALSPADRHHGFGCKKAKTLGEESRKFMVGCCGSPRNAGWKPWRDTGMRPAEDSGILRSWSEGPTCNSAERSSRRTCNRLADRPAPPAPETPARPGNKRRHPHGRGQPQSSLSPHFILAPHPRNLTGKLIPL